MSAHVLESGTPVLRTDTGAIFTGNATLIGFYVNSTTGGTLVIASVTNGAISGTITPAIGFHRFPAFGAGGLSVTIANTISVTFFVVPAAG